MAVEDGLLKVERWGRRRYRRVAGPGVVAVLETLSPLAPAKEVRSLRQSRALEAIETPAPDKIGKVVTS